jgi:hypothetical protein
VTQFKTLRAVLQFEVAMKKRKVPSTDFGGGNKRRHYTRGPSGRVVQLEYILSLGRLNDEYDFASHGLRVLVHISQEQYLKWAGISYEEFMHRRRVQGVEFEFI